MLVNKSSVFVNTAKVVNQGKDQDPEPVPTPSAVPAGAITERATTQLLAPVHGAPAAQIRPLGDDAWG